MSAANLVPFRDLGTVTDSGMCRLWFGLGLLHTALW